MLPINYTHGHCSYIITHEKAVVVDAKMNRTIKETIQIIKNNPKRNASVLFESYLLLGAYSELCSRVKV